MLLLRRAWRTNRPRLSLPLQSAPQSFLAGSKEFSTQERRYESYSGKESIDQDESLESPLDSAQMMDIDLVSTQALKSPAAEQYAEEATQPKVGLDLHEHPPVNHRRIARLLTDNPQYTTDYNAIIRYYEHVNMIRYANEIFEDMLDDGHQPNRLSFKFMVLSNIKHNKYREVIQYYKHSVKKLQYLDIISHNAVMTACCDTLTFRDAMSVYDDMNRLELKPNSRSYAILLRACQQNHRPDVAVKLMEKMKADGIEANSFTIAPLLQLLSTSIYTIDDALAIFDEHSDKLVSFPTAMISIMSGLVAAGRTTELARFREKYNPTPNTYFSIFKALNGDKVSKIMELWGDYSKEAKVHRPSIQNLRATLNAAIGALELNICPFNLENSLRILESISGLYTINKEIDLVDSKAISSVLLASVSRGNIDQVSRAWKAVALTSTKINPGILTKLLSHVKTLGNEDLEKEIIEYRDSLNAQATNGVKSSKPAHKRKQYRPPRDMAQ